MNAAETRAALLRRGYGAGQADLAMTRAMTHGSWGLSRHRVSYDPGTGEYRVAPLPWEGDGQPVPPDALFTVRPGVMLTIEWSGERRTVICDRIFSGSLETPGAAVFRDLTEAEQDELDQAAYDEFEAMKREAGQ